MNGQCKFCGQTKDLREGGCWECANAEAIIDEGLDMYDKGIKDASPGQKLKLLIERGWTQLSNLEKQKLNQ